MVDFGWGLLLFAQLLNAKMLSNKKNRVIFYGFND